jgi:anhydro-N-acetylmuramic acid kinase
VVLESVVEEALRAPYFRQKPPKTAGREEFGREYAQAFLQWCGRAAKPDIIATATALTANSIADAVERFVLPNKRGNFGRMIASGGGTKNPVLMKMLQRKLKTLGIRLRHSERYGIPSQAKEAMAFALLAYQTWHRQPGNVPSATGAEKPVVLGKISYV